MKQALRVVAAVALASATASQVTGTATAAVSARVSDLSAARLVALSLASAQRAGWCTNVSQGTAVGYTFGASTDSGPDIARQSLRLNSSSGEARLLRGRLYVRESATLLAAQFGRSAPQWANKWLLLPAHDAVAVSLSSGMLFSSMIAQVRPTGTLRRSPVGTARGVAVIAVSGSANARLGLTRGVETLYVAARAPFLPVELLAGGRVQGVPTSLSVTFSQWGHHFSLSAPTGVTPLSATDLP